ncbi:hypothetical protein FOZ62_011590, partial [Perkinsus olseni]
MPNIPSAPEVPKAHPLQLRREPEAMRIGLLSSIIDEGFLGIRETIWRYTKSHSPTSFTRPHSDPWASSMSIIGSGTGNDAVAVCASSDDRILNHDMSSGDTLLMSLPAGLPVTSVLHHNGIVYYKVDDEPKLRRWSCNSNEEIASIPIDFDGRILASGGYLFCLTFRAECRFCSSESSSPSSAWYFWFNALPMHKDPFSALMGRLRSRDATPHGGEEISRPAQPEPTYSLDVVVSSESWQCAYNFYSNRGILYMQVNGSALSFSSGQPLLDCCVIPDKVGLVAATSLSHSLRVHVIDILAGVILHTSADFDGSATNSVHVLRSGRIVYEYEGMEEDEISLGS